MSDERLVYENMRTPPRPKKRTTLLMTPNWTRRENTW